MSESIRTKDPVAVRTYFSESLKLEALKCLRIIYTSDVHCDGGGGAKTQHLYLPWLLGRPGVAATRVQQAAQGTKARTAPVSKALLFSDMTPAT